MSWQGVGILVVLIVVAAVLIAIGVWLLHWLYRRSSKETSFVRTGFGGQKVVMNGGAFVLPPCLHSMGPGGGGVMRQAGDIVDDFRTRIQSGFHGSGVAGVGA